MHTTDEQMPYCIVVALLKSLDNKIKHWVMGILKKSALYQYDKFKDIHHDIWFYICLSVKLNWFLKMYYIDIGRQKKKKSFKEKKIFFFLNSFKPSKNIIS